MELEPPRWAKESVGAELFDAVADVLENGRTSNRDELEAIVDKARSRASTNVSPGDYVLHENPFRATLHGPTKVLRIEKRGVRADNGVLIPFSHIRGYWPKGTHGKDDDNMQEAVF